MPLTIRTTAVFARPFRLADFDEVLPAGEYELETELLDQVDAVERGDWTSSVLVHLHPRESHPGLSRTLTVTLAELEKAVAKDKLTGKALTEYFLEEMLADPMVCLVMQADGVSEEEIRRLYSSHPEASSLAMTGDPVDLDGRRSPAGKIATEIRRHSTKKHATAEDARRKYQDDLDAQMRVGSASTWADAAEAARFLIHRYAMTPEAQDARLQTLIERSLDDLARLADQAESHQ